MSRLIASLSLDLDNQWAYLRAAGRDHWETSDSYFPQVIPRIVQTLQELNLPLTTFLVGRDLVHPDRCESISQLTELSEWEFANHSFNHEPWLHTLAESEIAAEIDETSEAIKQNWGTAPVGFRGPGFSCPPAVLGILAERGFRYDASVFPTSMAPVARAYYMMKTGLRGADRDRASQLYGGWKAMRQPNRPFQRTINATNLWEIPVTVMPGSRTPIHFSYLTYLASFSKLAAKQYFRTTLRLCQMSGTSPSLLLHPPDFMGAEDAGEMSFFPAMKMRRESKLGILRWALGKLANQFDVRTLRSQVDSLDGGHKE
ncbi:Polysaccharide deacetylase [Roseimaritima multifibrata]|uniref:Polysaccharide deacetylase n=1 Tax=Roseimaritima multifibrata TaxID=1930274 RepID=A0A517ML49_9BACT|nr:polysaccharide deacetylase family protein [Roseimaritima multifibrata]QDS95604.1 Polysaccharide deacetylase [Roseimaritima multifibrata]